MIGRLLAGLKTLGDKTRRLYHDWWIADEEESRSLDERETALSERQRASITYYPSRRKR
jgi:hypothetical protein